MIFGWFQERRRRKILAKPVPARWRAAIRENARWYRSLAAEEREKLERDLRLLIAEKNWEGARGVRVSGTMKAIVAAQACLLVLNRSVDDFERLHTVLIYPRAYRAVRRCMEGGIVMEGEGGALGESWPAGTVVLSWEDILRGGERPDDGRNLVLHEFAHQLDTADHRVDGTPILDGREAYGLWVEVMTAELESLRAKVRCGEPDVLDAYAATDEAEFFAVSTEAFFEKPGPMRTQRPALYGVLREYYRQDPASRGATG